MSGTTCHTHLTRHQLFVFILSCLQFVHKCYRWQKLEYRYNLHYKSEMVLHVVSCLKLKTDDVQCWDAEGHKSVNSYHGIMTMLIKQPHVSWSKYIWIYRNWIMIHTQANCTKIMSNSATFWVGHFMPNKYTKIWLKSSKFVKHTDVTMSTITSLILVVRVY